MDLDLPVLDIVEDIAAVMSDESDEEPPQKVISEEEHQKMMEEEEEKKQPFVRKTAPKKKKELSEKQLAHLNKIRGMALEKRQLKAKARKDAVDKVVNDVKETHKAKYYKPKPKKTPEEKALDKEAKKKYKKNTIRKNAIPVQTPAKPKPASVPQILQPVEENPFSNYFG